MALYNPMASPTSGSAPLCSGVAVKLVGSAASVQCTWCCLNHATSDFDLVKTNAWKPAAVEPATGNLSPQRKTMEPPTVKPETANQQKTNWKPTNLEAAKQKADEPEAAKPNDDKPEAAKGLPWLAWHKGGQWVGSRIQSLLPPEIIGGNKRGHIKRIVIQYYLWSDFFIFLISLALIVAKTWWDSHTFAKLWTSLVTNLPIYMVARHW